MSGSLSSLMELRNATKVVNTLGNVTTRCCSTKCAGSLHIAAIQNKHNYVCYIKFVSQRILLI